jgi:hypothetical protein
MIDEVENLYQILRIQGLASPTPKMKVVLNHETNAVKNHSSNVNIQKMSLINSNRMDA